MSREDLSDTLCEVCKDYADIEGVSINTNQFNLCEGSYCGNTADRYLDDDPFTYLKFNVILYGILDDCVGMNIDERTLRYLRSLMENLIYECIVDGRIHQSNIPSFTVEQDNDNINNILINPADKKTCYMVRNTDYEMCHPFSYTDIKKVEINYE